MNIYRLTRRYKFGEKPFECTDTAIEYAVSPKVAREFVLTLLGQSGTKVDDDFGFECYTNKNMPNVEYYIDEIRVME